MVKVAHTHILTSATIEVPNDATVSLPVTCWLNSEQVNVDVPVRNYGITARRRRMIRSKAKYRNTAFESWMYNQESHSTQRECAPQPYN